MITKFGAMADLDLFGSPHNAEQIMRQGYEYALLHILYRIREKDAEGNYLYAMPLVILARIEQNRWDFMLHLRCFENGVELDEFLDSEEGSWRKLTVPQHDSA